MNPHRILSHLQNLKRSVLATALLAAFLILCGVGIVSSTAQSAQDDFKVERKFANTIPEHVPLKVKVKNLNNEKWARDVEVEVTNTGNKPIYHLSLSLFFVDVKMDNGDQIGFPLRYGRPEMVDVKVRAIPEDVPIQPGETYVFKAGKGLALGWEKFKTKNNKPHPKKIGLRFDALNFGDGTGFLTTGGLPVYDSQTFKSSCGEQRNEDTFIKAAWNVLQDTPHPATSNIIHLLPANFLPVNFSSTKNYESIPSYSPLQSGLCCPGTPCFFMKLTVGGNCFCAGADPPFETRSVNNCNDSSARCGTQRTEQSICDSEGHTCTTYFIDPCASADPDPTPPPTPTPSPTPCATPDPATRPNPSCVPFGPCPPQGTQGWSCAPCSGPIVHYPAHPQTNGCPDGYFNDGTSNCCVPVTPPTGCQATDDQIWACNLQQNCRWSDAYCDCRQMMDESSPCVNGPSSPILIDVEGDGFSLTDAAGGVTYDFYGMGRPVRISWTATNSDDAWLALDRDGNGLIDSSRELFGNFTPQPAPPAGEEKHGFLALAVYDRTDNGGNADGVINRRDSIFSSLRLWQDVNHNGVSEPEELHRLSALGVKRLHLRYKESKRTDEHGNRFKYRAKVDDGRDAQVGRWAWDVFLLRGQ